MEYQLLSRQKINHVRGFIVYQECENQGQSAMEYLLLKKKLENDWSPPKGKRERKSDGKWENEIETARRETNEETGLIEGVDFKLLHHNICFQYTNPSNIRKIVTLWPAKLQSSCVKVIRLSQEHEEFRWFKTDEGIKIIKDEYRAALKQAINRINNS
ncbi:bis(5'-nucleosyl)-tetraphosphatase [asymmetrical] isoform X2 [Folsomia candida]|uniref:bis(5'-nucleosyl)-tetraphosphatase [asymmetrical] isoform X2 n=1 Tax=Folsomia candida TaxID=158441 RepID=UPI000B8FCDAC|nr:bis(5'-nucleosyl)-tetraphosphatase [asymmetrical] isoform X2 [Folsomia candida]